MKIAFYIASNGNSLDKIISLVSFSKYSHCEIVFSDGMCASSSSRDGGVRFKNINLESGNWVTFDLPEEFDEALVRYWFQTHEGLKYDWLGAAGSTFKLDWSSENRKFCSYVCSSVLGIGPNITPGELFRILIKAGIINE